MQRELRETLPVFHWMAEFPEVFYADRPDPLDYNEVNRAALMDCFVGNPPFAGKNAITESNGDHYIHWLMEMRPEVKGRPNTDLCAYFFRRTADLLGAHGAIGLLATNTIAEGDSRLMALKPLLDGGAVIYDAESSRPWPGEASVSVSVVHLAFGNVALAIEAKFLDGVPSNSIDSRLRQGREQADPLKLTSNAGVSFMGGKLVGAGFAVTLEEHANLVARSAKNAVILRPYLGGEDVNQNPGSAFSRYVIDFSTKTLEEAREWPLLLHIAEEKVRPDRANDRRGTYRTYWWRPGESGGAMYSAL